MFSFDPPDDEDTNPGFELDVDPPPPIKEVYDGSTIFICPQCFESLIGRKCKLFCETVGCGYMVTCSE